MEQTDGHRLVTAACEEHRSEARGILASQDFGELGESYQMCRGSHEDSRAFLGGELNQT